MTEEVAPKTETPKEKEKLFSTPQIVAGAMAASTSAILGSQLGVAGTVGGAAIGSIATAVATTLYRAGIDKTRDGLVQFGKMSQARIQGIKPTPAAVAAAEPIDEHDTAIAPGADLPVAAAVGAASASTIEPSPKPERPRRRPKWVMATAAGLASAAAAFALAIGGITGYEAIAGHSISGGRGTTVGQVVRQAPDRTEEPEPQQSESPQPQPSETTTTQSEAPSPEPTPSETTTTETQQPQPEPTNSEPAPTQSQPQTQTQAPEPAPTES